MFRLSQNFLPRVAGVIFDGMVAYLLCSIWSIIELGLFSTHEILSILIPGKLARDFFVFILIYFSWRAIGALFIGVTLGQYLSGLEARGESWWKLRVIAPVRVMLDFFDPLDLTKFKERLTGTELHISNPKTVSIYSFIVIVFSFLMLPASGFLKQTQLSSKLTFSELSITKNNTVSSGEIWRSNTFKFSGTIDSSKYLFLPKYSFRMILGKRLLVPEFYLYQNESKTWIEISNDGRWDWATFLDKFNADKQLEDLPKPKNLPDSITLAQAGNIKSHLIESDSIKLVSLLKMALDPNAKDFMTSSHLRVFTEKFLGSFNVIFTAVELWHVGESSFLILSDFENSVALSLNALKPTILRLHHNGSDASKFIAKSFLKDWLSNSSWAFDYERPFELDTTRQEFFSYLDFFPLTSALPQNHNLYEYWLEHFSSLKKMVMTSNDRVLQNLFLDSMQSILMVERAKKTINPDWVQMMEDLIGGLPGGSK